MGQFLKIANVSDIPDGQGRAFPAGDCMIAIFRQGDEFFAIDDFCPHMGASLAEGYLCDGAVACPWHAWRFSIRDGSWLDNPKIRVDAFRIEQRGDELWYDPDPIPKSP